MKYALIISIVASVTTGCASLAVDSQSAQVVWHKMNRAQLADHCLAEGVRSPLYNRVQGCYQVISNVCHIYAEDTLEGMQHLGHELKHCFDGLYHDTNGEWYPRGVTADKVKYRMVEKMNFNQHIQQLGN